MYHRYLSPDEALDLFQKHLSDHVENVKQHRFEFAHYEEADIEEDCAYLTDAVSLRDNVRNLRGLLIWAEEQRAKEREEQKAKQGEA